MADKKAAATEKTYVTIDGEEYETSEVPYGNKLYTLRELSVKENDDIETASTDAQNVFNGKLNLRLCLVHSIVSPATTVEDIEKWPGRKYLVLSKAFNAINSLPVDSEGNA